MTDQLRADPSPGAPLSLSRHLVYHKQRLILHSSIFSAASHRTPPRDNMSHGEHAKTGQWALARKKTGGFPPVFSIAGHGSDYSAASTFRGGDNAPELCVSATWLS